MAGSEMVRAGVGTEIGAGDWKEEDYGTTRNSLKGAQ